jgi:endogenous inhibitor of DNA gyrase (YacG/DUF329 family)
MMVKTYRRSKVIAKCQYCGKEYTPRIDNKHHVFCSTKCRLKDHNSRRRANDDFRKELERLNKTNP